jgi:hypothetical protein
LRGLAPETEPRLARFALEAQKLRVLQILAISPGMPAARET